MELCDDSLRLVRSSSHLPGESIYFSNFTSRMEGRRGGGRSSCLSLLVYSFGTYLSMKQAVETTIMKRDQRAMNWEEEKKGRKERRARSG